MGAVMVREGVGGLEFGPEWDRSRERRNKLSWFQSWRESSEVRPETDSLLVWFSTKSNPGFNPPLITNPFRSAGFRCFAIKPLRESKHKHKWTRSNWRVRRRFSHNFANTNDNSSSNNVWQQQHKQSRKERLKASSHRTNRNDLLRGWNPEFFSSLASGLSQRWATRPTTTLRASPTTWRSSLRTRSNCPPSPTSSSTSSDFLMTVSGFESRTLISRFSTDDLKT